MRSSPNAMFDESELHACHQNLMTGLRNHFHQLPQLKAVFGKRKAFEGHLKALSLNTDVFEGHEGKVTLNLRAGDPGIPNQAIFKVDMQIECNGLCGQNHTLNIELCIQNREAIGTNFLKLETLAQLQPATNPIGVLICPDSRYFAASNMDGAYADDDEYIVAFKLSYHHLLKSKLLVLSMGD